MEAIVAIIQLITAIINLALAFILLKKERIAKGRKPRIIVLPFRLYHKGLKMELLNAVLGLFNASMLLYIVIKLKRLAKI